MVATAYFFGALVFTAGVTIVTGGADLYADLIKIQGLLRTADDRLNQLSTRTCQSGTGYVSFCPFYGDISWSDTVTCIVSNLRNGPVAKVVDIYFDKAFVAKPSAVVFTSGLTWAFGATYNITILKASSTGLTVQVTGLFTPSEVHFNYYACDQEALFPKAYLDIQDAIAFYSQS